MLPRIPTVDIVYFDAGGGHRATANAINQQLIELGWQVNTINLRDVLDKIDPINNWFGIKVEDFYNKYIGTGLTYGSGPMLRILQSAIKLFNKRIEDAIFDFWLKRGPSDLVVSVIPNFNKQLYNGIKRAYKIPYVTVMCDLADCPPHFWMESQDQYMVCGSDKAWYQAKDVGYENIRILSGMIVNPKFYNNRKSSDISTTGIVSYGGMGSSNILDIARMINRSPLRNKLNMIFICGKNEKVFKKLCNEKLDYYHELFGFTDQLPMLMDRSSFFIGKPGPGSINEALVKKLPVLVEDSKATMVQEQYNIEWILKYGFGEKFKLGDVETFDNFILNLNKYKYNVGRYNNKAVFEISEILTDILTKENRI